MTILKPIICLASALFFLVSSLSAQVVVNEYSAANLATTPDNYGKYEDWIEFFNPDSVAVDISNWQLSDNPNKPDKWKFPQGTIVAPGGFLVVWLSGRDEAVGGFIHANFKLTQTKSTQEHIVFHQRQRH